MPRIQHHELVVPRHLWERNLRELLIHPDRVAVGVCDRNVRPESCELLVRQLEVRSVLPHGEDQPRLSDSIVLGVPTGEAGRDASRWIERLQPLPTQLLALALVGMGPDRSSWDGCVVENGQVERLDAIRVVGPGMMCLRRPANSEWIDPTKEDLERWSRTRGALGDAVWNKVAESRVLLIGAGRNGSAMAFQLAALGIRALTIVDPDHLGCENLDASFCVTEQDVGRPKSVALQERLVAFRSGCAITSIEHAATHPLVSKQARNADLIVTCVDNDSPRLAAALLAGRFLRPHLDVGTGVTLDDAGQRVLAGDVRLLLPQQGCMSCVGGLRNEEEARYELFAPPGALKRRSAMPWNQERAGSLITLNSMTVAMAVQLWLDLVTGTLRHSHWHRLRWRAGAGIEPAFASVDAGLNCSICQNVTNGMNRR